MFLDEHEHSACCSLSLRCLFVKAEGRAEGLNLSFVQVYGLQKFLVKEIKGVDSHTVVEPVLVETCKEISQQVHDGDVIARNLYETLRGIQTPDDLFDLVEKLRVTLFDSGNRR